MAHRTPGIWTAHVLTGLQLSVAPIGGSARIIQPTFHVANVQPLWTSTAR
jgi:hypothetical protein